MPSFGLGFVPSYINSTEWRWGQSRSVKPAVSRKEDRLAATSEFELLCLCRRLQGPSTSPLLLAGRGPDLSAVMAGPLQRPV